MARDTQRGSVFIFVLNPDKPENTSSPKERRRRICLVNFVKVDSVPCWPNPQLEFGMFYSHVSEDWDSKIHLRIVCLFFLVAS